MRNYQSKSTGFYNNVDTKSFLEREFVLGLIEETLNEAERQAVVSPCEGQEDQPQEEVDPAVLGEEKAV